MTALCALVGSGEFLPVMEPVDRRLLEGRPSRAVFLPTAAAEEGAERVRYWVDLGTAHFLRLGARPVPLLVLDRDDADDPALAAQVAGAGLVYLSGGNPGYLARTLRGSRVWEAVLAAVDAGGALAGCSAGAAALGRLAPDVRDPTRHDETGLGVCPRLAVIPHFDRVARWRPTVVDEARARLPADVELVGIDEETALVGGPERFEVMGRGRAWLLGRFGWVAIEPGEVLELPAPGGAAAAREARAVERREPRVGDGDRPRVEVVVEKVPAAATFPLRQRVLRPHQRVEELASPLDELPGAASFAARPTVGGEVVGTATVAPEDPPRARLPAALAPGAMRWRLRGMATAPGWRGLGVGTAVLGAVVAHVAGEGGGLLWANARLAAAAFYERAGFCRHGDVFEEPAIGPHVVVWRLVAPEPRGARHAAGAARAAGAAAPGGIA